MLRPPGKSFRSAGCCALCAAVWATCSASPPLDDDSRWDPCAALSTPSKLDYLVLASIADSPRLLALAGYRSTATPPDALVTEDEATLEGVPTQFRAND